MRHLDDHTLEEFVLGNLGADQHKMITEHLRVCTKCRDLAEKYREEIARLRAVLNLAHESRRNDCPSNEILALFSGRGINGAKFEGVENHLAQCSDCRVALQAIRHELTMLQSISETDWAELEQTTFSPPGTPIAMPSVSSVLRYVAAAFAWRYASVVLMAAILALGGWGPEKFRSHSLVVAVIFGLSPVLRDRDSLNSGPISIGRHVMYSALALAFLAAWIFPRHSYWLLALSVIGGGLLLLPSRSKPDSKSESVTLHRSEDKSQSSKSATD